MRRERPQGAPSPPTGPVGEDAGTVDHLGLARPSSSSRSSSWGRSAPRLGVSSLTNPFTRFSSALSRSTEGAAPHPGGLVGVDALAPVAEDARPVRRQPGQVGSERLLVVAGSGNSIHARGKSGNLGHDTRVGLQTRVGCDRRQGLSSGGGTTGGAPCGWPCSTSAPTPCTCWWWTHTRAPAAARLRQGRAAAGRAPHQRRPHRRHRAVPVDRVRSTRSGREPGHRGPGGVRHLRPPGRAQRRRCWKRWTRPASTSRC